MKRRQFTRNLALISTAAITPGILVAATKKKSNVPNCLAICSSDVQQHFIEAKTAMKSMLEQHQHGLSFLEKYMTPTKVLKNKSSLVGHELIYENALGNTITLSRSLQEKQIHFA